MIRLPQEPSKPSFLRREGPEIINTGGGSAFEKNKYKVINALERLANNEACNEAFRRAGLRTPKEIYDRGRGVILGSKLALRDSAYNHVLGITEDQRSEAVKSGAPALTFTGTARGKPIILFGADAFDDDYLNESIPHETIHAAGVPKGAGANIFQRWSISLGLDHDLKFYKHYNDIIKHCK